MKRGTLDHWKTAALAKRLHLHGRYRVGGILEALWHFCALYTPDGAIGRIPPEAVADWIGYDQPAKLMAALTACRWIDGEGSAAIIHDWPAHAEDSVHMRLARAHQRFADGSAPKLTRLGRAERLAARAFFQNGHETPPAQIATPPHMKTTKAKQDDYNLRTLARTLRRHDLHGWPNVIDWASKLPGPPPDALWCWRCIGYGIQTNRAAPRAGLKNLGAAWIALIQKAKFAPPDADLATARAWWNDTEQASQSAPQDLQHDLQQIGGPQKGRDKK